MFVASKELCEELHKLSGWKIGVVQEYFRQPSGEWLLASIAETPTDLELEPTPAYDLGYLIRKLPRTIGEDDSLKFLSLEPHAANSSQWGVRYSDEQYKHPEHICYADFSPEDAVAQLCIRLFKQGILTKDGGK